MIGQTISHYRVISRLGSGGMGVVYRAEDTRLQRPVALKFLRPGAASDPAAAERLQREARAASSLNHPNICTVYDVGEFAGQPFIAMELIEGETLAERLSRGALPVDEALAFATEIADALSAASARGIVHRDLKPGNIAVTAAGHAKVLDFGLAKMAGADVDATVSPLTSAGVALGTVAYMAPEQARGQPVDERSDIFSFGLILYEMLTGAPAFAGSTMAVIFDALLNRDLPPVRLRVPAVPPALDRLVARMTSKPPASRPQASREVLDELRAIQRGSSSDHRAAAARPVPGIAVLPFKDLSPGGDQQYFCEGMADEIITALSSLGGIQVASRTSAVRCQEKGLDVAEIGLRLGVQHVVEGSVRKMGNRVRITGQLTNVIDSYQLWTERYDRDLDDVFAVQDEIARAIAERLHVKLTGQAEAPLVRKATANAEAYALCLKGRYHWARRNRWHLRAALECFERAVALDPGYALPYAGVADCYTVMSIYGVRPGTEFNPLALGAARRALDLDPTLAEAHHSLGAVLFWADHDIDGAERAYRRALELNPGLAITHAYLALMYAAVHRRAEAREAAARAMALEPDSGVLAYLAGGASYWNHDYEQADRFTTCALELERDAAFPHWVRALCLCATGRYDEAVQAAERGVVIGDRQPLLTAALGHIYGRVNRTADAEAILHEFERRSAQEYIAPCWVADVLIGLHRLDEAVDCLNRACEEQNGFIMRAGTAVEFDAVRDHPRFRALLRRLNLPDTP